MELFYDIHRTRRRGPSLQARSESLVEAWLPVDVVYISLQEEQSLQGRYASEGRDQDRVSLEHE